MAATDLARSTGMLDVLIIDDVHEDAELMVLELQRAGFEVRPYRVDSAAGMSAALDREHWDVILCDYTMPNLTYQAALSLVRDRGLLAPFLLVSATVLDETAIEAMRAAKGTFARSSSTAQTPSVSRTVRAASAMPARPANALLDTARRNWLGATPLSWSTPSRNRSCERGSRRCWPAPVK
jgi:CheY-like chemotaxis protein